MTESSPRGEWRIDRHSGVGGSAADQDGIRRLLYRYAMGIDDLDHEALADCFDEGATLWADNPAVVGGSFRLTGPEGIASQLVAWHRGAPFTMHNVVSHLYSVREGAAEGRAYCVETAVLGEPGAWRRVDVGIHYYDRMIERDGRWRFAERQYVQLFLDDRALETFTPPVRAGGGVARE